MSSDPDWLLARFDRLARRSFGPQGDRPREQRGDNFQRPLFELLDDHPGDHCDDGCCPGELEFYDLAETA